MAERTVLLDATMSEPDAYALEAERLPPPAEVPV